jgi:hypothetical protein
LTSWLTVRLKVPISDSEVGGFIGTSRSLWSQATG